jgi:hypothetical protein
MQRAEKEGKREGWMWMMMVCIYQPRMSEAKKNSIKTKHEDAMKK